MKKRITAVLLSGCFLAVQMAATAGEEGTSAPKPRPNALAIAADVVIVRPVGVASTLVGSAFFVITSPISALTKSTKSTADLLVHQPARATFKRPLGDLEALADY